ncbi:hypothetical protein [Parabacteroides sp. AF14-59]|jgi:hypothetical protein|nr:hypothetical protein [Parabacteroides sp. AF14-59]
MKFVADTVDNIVDAVESFADTVVYFADSVGNSLHQQVIMEISYRIRTYT